MILNSLIGFIMSVLQNNTTFRFHSLVYGQYALLLTSKQMSHFSLYLLHLCLPFGFVFMRMRRVRILKFQDSVYLKSEQCLQTIQ